MADERRVLVVCNNLPFTCEALTGRASSGLVPDELGRPSPPVRAIRRARSSINLSFVNLMSLSTVQEALPATEQAEPGNGRAIRGWKQHQAFLVPEAHAVYIGHANTTDVANLDSLRTGWRCVPILGTDRARFEAYCSKILTPLFHYKLFEKKRLDVELMDGWEDFQAVNERFAEAIVATYQLGDRVLIMDHRLLLVPRMVKDMTGGAVPVALHWNVPFPSSEIIRCHPQAAQLIDGMLGSDLIAFQVYSYIRHFLSSCTRLLGLESAPKGVECNGIPVQLRVIPIGVDSTQVAAEMQTERARAKLEAMRKVFHGKRVILGIDGPESAKGVCHKLEAYERLLELQPTWIGEASLVQITTPDSEYDTRCDQRILDLAARINNRFGYLGYNPVHVFHLAPEHEEYLALLTIANVFTVISERAAYSIPALDFVVCQGKRHGMLVLSEFIGNAPFVPGAFTVNPWDHAELANVLHDALTVPIDSMVARHAQMLRGVECTSSRFWFETLMQELDESHTAAKQYTITPVLDVKAVVRQYMLAAGRLFLLDYDGTLVGIQRTPSEAVPTPELLGTLRVLTADPLNVVYVISGRDRTTLSGMLGLVPGIGLSAEHGCYLRLAETGEWSALIKEEELTWKLSVLQIMEYYHERTPGSLIEEKSASLTWHYRLADQQFGSWQAKELQNYIEQSLVPSFSIEVLAGKKNIEVLPAACGGAVLTRAVGAAEVNEQGEHCQGPAGAPRRRQLCHVHRRRPHRRGHVQGAPALHRL